MVADHKGQLLGGGGIDRLRGSLLLLLDRWEKGHFSIILRVSL